MDILTSYFVPFIAYLVNVKDPTEEAEIAVKALDMSVW